MVTVNNLGEVAPRDIGADVLWQIELAPDGGVRRIGYADFHKDADGVARSSRRGAAASGQASLARR